MLNRFSGYRLISLFGIILIIGVWFFVWKQITFEYHRELADVSREGMNIARIYEDHVRTSLQEVDRDLLVLRAVYQRSGFSSQALRTQADRMRENLIKTQIGFIDEQGRLRSLLNETARPYDVVDRDYFVFQKESATDKLYIGKTILGRQSAETTITMSRRITNTDGSFGGAVVIAIKTAYFTKSFELLELGSGKSFSLVGMDGIVRLRQGEDDERAESDVRQNELYQAVLWRPFGTMMIPNGHDGSKHIHSYRELPEYSVYIDVAMAEDDVLKDFIHRKNVYITVATLSTLFIVVFCGLLMRRNLKQRELENRLSTLQETTSRLLIDSVDSDSLLQTIMQDVLRLVGASHGLIATMNPEGTEWIVRYGVGIQQKRIGDHLAVSEGLIGEVITRGQLIYVPDYASDPRRLSDSRLVDLRSIIGLPLMVGEKVVGALSADWEYVIPAPRKELLDTLRQYAYLASVALERTNSQAEILRIAYTDTLTGLPNRRSIYKRLAGEMDKACRGQSHGAVFFIDLDNLKLVNDTVGHSYGDILIVEASKHILTNAGKDAFVGRLAGDEFVVLLPNTKDRQEIIDIADKLIRSLDCYYDWKGASVRVTATAGIALFPDNGTTAEELLKNADAALYAAKKKGKQSWQFYDPAIQQHMREEMLFVNSLHHVLERGELALHYQPLMTQTGIPVGFEALLRWNSPEFGPVPPARFIPIAEQGQLIQLIGAWVLHKACVFAKRLTDLGRSDLRVDVNVSVLQLEADDFCDIVVAAIKAAGIEPSQLGLEITESVFMKSVEANAAKLRHLQGLGIKISLDDFGEGYSSLTMLLQLPVDTLKISRTLINMLGQDRRQIGFVSSVVEMAHALGLTVVAEGVETSEQLSHVIVCRCDWTQGYFFFRPMPEEEALRIVTR
jgi:diguanylate cyclase (GGDEF)-like protein